MTQLWQYCPSALLEGYSKVLNVQDCWQGHRTGRHCPGILLQRLQKVLHKL